MQWKKRKKKKTPQSGFFEAIKAFYSRTVARRMNKNRRDTNRRLTGKKKISGQAVVDCKKSLYMYT